VKSTRAVKVITSLSVGVVLLASLSWIGLGQVSGRIDRISVFAGLDNRPEKTSKALNYLLVGSDTREGLTKEEMKALRVGSTKTAAGGRSDTMLLVHISKKRDKAFLVSLPRDSLVTIPAHLSTDGKTQIPDREKRARAHFIIDTSRGFEAAGREVDSILRAAAYLEKAGAHARNHSGHRNDRA
jgi:anionic cell wall polymer biosynthesis LytR-Cps2A-Psr (LCP) family protein